MSDRRRGSPAGRFVGPAGLQRLGGGDAMCPRCGAENDVGSAHCVACGRRVNAPEAGNEGLGDSVAAAPTEGDVWSMYASGAGATSTTGPSETTGSDVAGPLPPPSGPRGDVLPAPGSADVSSPARLHGDNRTPEPLERSNRPRSTLPLVALGAAVAVVLACVGLALAVRFGDGDDAATGSLGGDTEASTAVSSNRSRQQPSRRWTLRRRPLAATSVATTVPVVAHPVRRLVDGFVAVATSPASPVQSPTTAPPPPASPPRSVAVTSPRNDVGSTCSTIRCHRGCAAPSSCRPCRPLSVLRTRWRQAIGTRRAVSIPAWERSATRSWKMDTAAWTVRRCYLSMLAAKATAMSCCLFGRQRACGRPDDAVLRPVHRQLNRARAATVGDRFAAVLGHKRARGRAGEPGCSRPHP